MSTVSQDAISGALARAWTGAWARLGDWLEYDFIIYLEACYYFMVACQHFDGKEDIAQVHFSLHLGNTCDRKSCAKSSAVERIECVLPLHDSTVVFIDDNWRAIFVSLAIARLLRCNVSCKLCEYCL